MVDCEDLARKLCSRRKVVLGRIPSTALSLPIIWFSPTLGYQIVPDDITNAISVVVVAVATYYAIKIVRLSDKFD